MIAQAMMRKTKKPLTIMVRKPDARDVDAQFERRAHPESGAVGAETRIYSGIDSHFLFSTRFLYCDAHFLL